LLLAVVFTQGISVTHGLVTPFACRNPPLPFVQPPFASIEALLAGFNPRLALVKQSLAFVEATATFPDHGMLVAQSQMA
jgi:hypothetical protein